MFGEGGGTGRLRCWWAQVWAVPSNGFGGVPTFQDNQQPCSAERERCGYRAEKASC